MRLFPSFMLILMLVFAGCAAPNAAQRPTSDAAASTSASPEPMTTLKVMMVCCYLSDAAFMIAQEEGYFADEGLEIEVLRYMSSAEGLSALLTGEADIMGGGIEPGIFNAVARGETLKIVADKGQSAEDCDYTSAVVRIEDLEKWQAADKEQLGRAQVAAAGNQSGSFYLDTMLETLGLSLQDFDVVDVPAPNRVEALVSSAVDLSLISEPWVTRALDTGKTALFNPARAVGSSVQLSVWVFGDALLNQNSDLGQRFIDAYVRGLRQFNEGKNERNITVIASGTQLEPALVERVCWPKLAADGQINVVNTELYKDWLLTNGWLATDVDLAQYWDGSFVEKAVQRLSGQP